MEESRLCLYFVLASLPCFIVAARLLYVLPAVKSRQHKEQKFNLNTEIRGANIMILLGSGGHTGEMMRLLNNVDLGEFSRTWVVSSSDSSSLEKAKRYEENMTSEYTAKFILVHRARNVGDSILASVKNTLVSLASVWKSLSGLSQFPKVLITNGPGTSVPLAYILFVMKFLNMCDTRIIYVESLARVESLSLSGRLLLPISDRFIVQWEKLSIKYHRAEYYGILV